MEHYKSTDYIFLLDQLLNMEESEFSSVKLHTATLKGGKLFVDENYSRQTVP